MASASIAQVHKATLKDGTVVAVKVQKPEIKTQIGWDLFCYSLIMRGLEIFFELPVASSAEYVTSHIHQETDFINEAHNGEKCQEFIKNVPSLNATCHVPKIYWDLTTKRILTAEWIDGIALSDTTAIQKTFNAAHVMTLIVNLFADVNIFSFSKYSERGLSTATLIPETSLYAAIPSRKFRKSYCSITDCTSSAILDSLSSTAGSGSRCL